MRSRRADRARPDSPKPIAGARPRGPTRAQLATAAGGTIPDVVAPGLDVLFCGINPGLYSAAMRQHFARPGNRFWPTLHRAGFTPRVFHPSEQRELLALGLGITNVVPRGTAAAAELSGDDLRAGARTLTRKVRRMRPRFLAVLGIGAYRAAFGRPAATLGEQADAIGGTRLWVLPNPSGLNAHYQPAELARLFRELRLAVEGAAKG